MEILIAADHRGFAHKEYIKEYLRHHGSETISWKDVGAHNAQRSDYPVFAHAACTQMIAGAADRAILICGSGIGMTVVANRYRGIYAALVWNHDVARLSKEHDNANVLVLPSDFVSASESVEIIRTWLDAVFLSGRYQERVAMIDE